MHFNGFDFSLDVGRSEGDVHTWLDNTGLDSSDWDGTNTTDFVNILKGKSQWLFSGSFWGDDLVKSFKKSWALVPGGVGRSASDFLLLSLVK